MWWNPNDMGRMEVLYDENTNGIIETWIPLKNAISYNVADDGRVAVCHNFIAEDSKWIKDYLQEVNGVTILDKDKDKNILPESWTNKKE